MATRQRLKALFELEIKPPSDPSDKPSIRADMARSSGEGMAEHFLKEARLRYEDVFRRLENVERRAATLQTAVVFAVTFTLTGGGLVLDQAKLEHRGWRIALALVVLVVIGLFVYSGFRAMRAGTWLKKWKVVGRRSLQGTQYANVDEARIQRAAAYIWCVNRNMPINAAKARELRMAFDWFIAGLAGLVVVAFILVLAAGFG